MSNIAATWGREHTSESPNPDGAPYDGNRNGFDLIYRQALLQSQMVEIEEDIRQIELSNGSDTEKMYNMQMAMNAWSAVANLRTNMLKSVADVLKTITRNVV
ncbi:EscF/YscF/HrpA family type III secretion system needle major subunit [Labrenzia sp. OB1]|uniref:EscF/YscF/HrpA family type III secretion system needle major subunit n=1 Tax=Labrenzia sp. OB1 TaxID=1561204 RepID=UPI0009EEBDAF|nr:EscF/YscF/HrpA family type III secretion system needle major subunit [Labrenzia sp. OB1]